MIVIHFWSDYHVRVKARVAWTVQYGPVSVGCTHSQVIPNTQILFHKDTKQQHDEDGASCKQHAPTTLLQKLLPSICSPQIPRKYQTQTDQLYSHPHNKTKNWWICLSHTHSSNPCSTLIAQLCYKGHPGVPASRSRPLSSPWWSPASLMSLSCLCILNVSLTLRVCVYMKEMYI